MGYSGAHDYASLLAFAQENLGPSPPSPTPPSPTPPSPTGPCDDWITAKNGYLEACGGDAGNVGTFSGLALEQAQDACCENPECAGFNYNQASGSGFYKGNQQCGFTQNSDYVGYTKPPAPAP